MQNSTTEIAFRCTLSIDIPPNDTEMLESLPWNMERKIKVPTTRKPNAIRTVIHAVTVSNEMFRLPISFIISSKMYGIATVMVHKMRYRYVTQLETPEGHS